ncbi:MAG: GNAT family N-acetyltransferase [Myxococcota bacterium]
MTDHEELIWRATEEADLPFVTEAEGNPENHRFVLPWSLERHLAALADPDILHACLRLRNHRVGYVILGGLRSTHRAIEFRRLVIVAKGLGFGRRSVRKVKEYAFGELGAHRLWLDVKAHNIRARTLYSTEGFREEGTLRDCIRGAEGWESLVVMSILQDEFRRWSLDRPE